MKYGSNDDDDAVPKFVVFSFPESLKCGFQPGVLQARHQMRAAKVS
jgi:hypothetical protein